MSRTLLCVFALAAFTTQAFAEQVIPPPPECHAENNPLDSFLVADSLADNLVVAAGTYAGRIYVVTLASCERLNQVRIELDGTFEQRTALYNEVAGAVMSSENYDFDELQAKFSADPYASRVVPIEADLCTCLSERM